jgi:hypothetical protein
MRLAAELPVRELQFYDEQGRKCQPEDNPAYQDILEELTEMPAYCRQIDEHLGVDSPRWLGDLERDARRFLGSLGFTNLKPIQLIREGDELEEIGFQKVGETDSVVALTDPFYDKIYVRQEKAAEMLRREGPISTGALLVHELAHDTASKIDVLAVQLQGDDAIMLHRSGFGIMDSKGNPQGLFLEEGFAHFMTGWYVRTKKVDSLTVISRSEPSMEVPGYYHISDELQVAGPDGYAIELLAYGIEQKGIMPASAFVATMLETRSPDTRTVALRTFAQAIDALRPGLYKNLRELQYSPEQWHAGLSMVHDAVQHPA